MNKTFYKRRKKKKRKRKEKRMMKRLLMKTMLKLMKRQKRMKAIQVEVKGKTHSMIRNAKEAKEDHLAIHHLEVKIEDKVILMIKIPRQLKAALRW